MTAKPTLTRRAALVQTLGLSLAPLLIATAASARGGQDPSDRTGKRWKPKRAKKTPQAPVTRATPPQG